MKRIFFLIIGILLIPSVVANDYHNGLKTSEIYIMPNKGQVLDAAGKFNKDVRYIIKRPNLDIALTDNSVHYVFYKRNDPKLGWDGKIKVSGEDAPAGKYLLNIMYQYRGKTKMNSVSVELNLSRT